MATGKRSKRPSAPHAARSPKSKGVAKGVLDRLAAAELAAVLRTLLKKHPDLESEAESIAVELVSSPSIDDTAEDVLDAVTSLDLDALNERAGNHSWGYVEPSEAAWELLQEAVEDVVADMKRRMDLGLDTAAEAICCGVVVGLYKATSVGSDGPLGWAPDFPAEEACHAVADLIRACPAENRGTVRDHLVEALGDLVPRWYDVISRAAERAVQEK